MKRAILLALPIASLACGCAEEPTFDERYDTARKTIQTTADEIDEDLEGAERGATSKESTEAIPQS
jgi:hypothetical protein